MTRLIGFRWKRREAWSREVLICPVSCAELCIAQSFVYFDKITYAVRMPTLRVFGSGGSAGGSYPISFRTRQSSLLAAMVLIVTDGESS